MPNIRHKRLTERRTTKIKELEKSRSKYSFNGDCSASARIIRRFNLQDQKRLKLFIVKRELNQQIQ